MPVPILSSMSPMRQAALCVIAILSCFDFCLGANVDQWRDRTIYQVLTDRFALQNGSHPQLCDATIGLYCGGTWNGIRDNLDYIQGMNFDAIWISPIVQQLPQRTADGEAYTAYWQQDLYSLNDHFGSQDDLHSLVDEAHRRNMLVMLDIVVNHFGYAGRGWAADYSVLNPFNESKYFHPYCPVDSSGGSLENMEECWLGDDIVALADVDTEREDVQQIYGDWIRDTIANYSFDGLRIDTSINVQSSFFPAFVEAAGVFATGEVLNGDNSISCQWESDIGSILNYPLYFPLIRAFTSSGGSISDLVDTIQSTKQNCEDPTAMGTFSENHDQPRFAEYTNDMSQAKNVITFTMMTDGIPIIYQGQEQHLSGGVSPYTNREALWTAGYNTDAPLYQHIKTLNLMRQQAIATSANFTTYETWPIWQSIHQLALRKGMNGTQIITVLDNSGAGTDPYELAVPNHGFEAGVQLTEVLTCTNLTVNGTGYINLPMANGTPKVLYPTRLLYNSSLCGMPDRDPSGATLPMTTITTPYATATLSGRLTTMTSVTVEPLPDTAGGEAPTSRIPAGTSSTATATATSTGKPNGATSIRGLCAEAFLPLVTGALTAVLVSAILLS